MGRPREYRPPRRPEGWTTICLLDAPRDEVVLGETATPDGCLELVAYTAEGTVWVGIRPKGSSTNAAIGLHPGSEEHYVAATASIHSSWGVAFGAVSPEIAQVEVRNERGEVSPGRVIPASAVIPGAVSSSLGCGQLRGGVPAGWPRRSRPTHRRSDGPAEPDGSRCRGVPRADPEALR